MSWINLEQAAAITGRSRRTVYLWIQKGKVKTFARRNISRLIDQEELLAYALVADKSQRGRWKRGKVTVCEGVD